MSQLFKRARKEQPAIGLISIGGEPGSEDGKWQAVLPNPFLGTDLQHAIQEANHERVGNTAKSE
jgi:hypothetical protein